MAKTGSPLHDPERKRSDPSMRDPECKSSRQMALLIPICAAAGGAQCVILRGLCQTAKSHSFSVSPVLCSTYLQPSDLAGLLCHPFCLQNAKVIPEVCVAAMGLNLLPTWLVLVSMGSITFLGWFPSSSLSEHNTPDSTPNQSHSSHACFLCVLASFS